MDLEQRGRDQLEIAKSYQEHYWYDHNSRDIPAHLGAAFRGHEEHGMVDLDLHGFAEHHMNFMRSAKVADDDIGAYIAGLFIFLRNGAITHEDMGDLSDAQVETVIFMSGGYIRKHALPEGTKSWDDVDQDRLIAETNAKGDLAEAFKKEADTDVTEIVQITLYERDAVNQIESCHAFQSFTITDGGRLKWLDEPLVTVSTSDERVIGGRIDQAILDSMKASTNE